METDQNTTIDESGTEAVEVKGQLFLVAPRYKDLIHIGEGAYGEIVVRKM